MVFSWHPWGFLSARRMRIYRYVVRCVYTDFTRAGTAASGTWTCRHNTLHCMYYYVYIRDYIIDSSRPAAHGSLAGSGA